MASQYDMKRLPPGSLLDLYSESSSPMWARSLGSLQDTFLQTLGMMYKMEQFEGQQDLAQRKLDMTEQYQNNSLLINKYEADLKAYDMISPYDASYPLPQLNLSITQGLMKTPEWEKADAPTRQKVLTDLDNKVKGQNLKAQFFEVDNYVDTQLSQTDNWFTFDDGGKDLPTRVFDSIKGLPESSNKAKLMRRANKDLKPYYEARRQDSSTDDYIDYTSTTFGIDPGIAKQFKEKYPDETLLNQWNNIVATQIKLETRDIGQIKSEIAAVTKTYNQVRAGDLGTTYTAIARSEYAKFLDPTKPGYPTPQRLRISDLDVSKYEDSNAYVVARAAELQDVDEVYQFNMLNMLNGLYAGYRFAVPDEVSFDDKLKGKIPELLKQTFSTVYNNNKDTMNPDGSIKDAYKDNAQITNKIKSEILSEYDKIEVPAPSYGGGDVGLFPETDPTLVDSAFTVPVKPATPAIVTEETSPDTTPVNPFDPKNLIDIGAAHFNTATGDIFDSETGDFLRKASEEEARFYASAEPDTIPADTIPAKVPEGYVDWDMIPKEEVYSILPPVELPDSGKPKYITTTEGGTKVVRSPDVTSLEKVKDKIVKLISKLGTEEFKAPEEIKDKKIDLKLVKRYQSMISNFNSSIAGLERKISQFPAGETVLYSSKQKKKLESKLELLKLKRDYYEKILLKADIYPTKDETKSEKSLLRLREHIKKSEPELF